jgi:hypothetical protein
MNTAIVDYRTTLEEIRSLEKLNIKILKCPNSKDLYPAVSGHPDMQICIVDKHNIILSSTIDTDFESEILKCNKNVHKTAKSLSSKYPEDVILNALILNDFFVHKLSCTDHKLLELVTEKEKINVKQGYTKCSSAVINDNAIITSDKSIIAELKAKNIDILYVPPGDIELPGLDYGFIGGSCGLLDEKHMAFFGDLTFYKYGTEVISFLKKHRVEPIYLKKGKLTDRGTLFML